MSNNIIQDKTKSSGIDIAKAENVSLKDVEVEKKPSKSTNMELMIMHNSTFIKLLTELVIINDVN